MIFGLYEIGARCDQAWLSDNLRVESRTFVNVVYSMIHSLPATTYLVCLTQNCVVSACECFSGPECSCARGSFISRKVAPAFKFCTTNFYRVNGDEKFHAVFCVCGLPVHWENKNILHLLEYTSSKLLQVVMFWTCILQAVHFSPGQHGDCSDEVSYESSLLAVGCQGSAWNYMTAVFLNFPFLILHPSYNLTLYSQSSSQYH